MAARPLNGFQERCTGLNYLIAICVQADPLLSLTNAHTLGSRVRSAIREDPLFLDAIVHMEPLDVTEVDADGGARPGMDQQWLLIGIVSEGT